MCANKDIEKCTYCGATEKEDLELYSGPVWLDPYADKPHHEDFIYCEDCANGNSHLEHFYFGTCETCDREFTEYGEASVISSTDNDVNISECLKCKRERIIKKKDQCKMCGWLADGYYCIGLCRSCEVGALLNISFPQTKASKKMVKLMSEAKESTKFRGHNLSQWVMSENCTVANAHCDDCKKIVTVREKPAPNQIDISGDALALSCND